MQVVTRLHQSRDFHTLGGIHHHQRLAGQITGMLDAISQEVQKFNRLNHGRRGRRDLVANHRQLLHHLEATAHTHVARRLNPRITQIRLDLTIFGTNQPHHAVQDGSRGKRDLQRRGIQGTATQSYRRTTEDRLVFFRQQIAVGINKLAVAINQLTLIVDLPACVIDQVAIRVDFKHQGGQFETHGRVEIASTFDHQLVGRIDQTVNQDAGPRSQFDVRRFALRRDQTVDTDLPI